MCIRWERHFGDILSAVSYTKWEDLFCLLLLAVMVSIVEIKRRVNIFIFLCFFIQNIGDGGEFKRSVSWEDLIQLLVRVRPTGPGGWGHGRGRGKLPSQHTTSPETMKYIK